MRGRGRGQVAPWVAAAVLVVTLGLSYLGKAVCVDAEPGFWGTTRYCYSDVRVLWSFRGYDLDVPPYAPAPEGYVEDYTFEYPPGMAFPAWAVALATDSRRGFFDLHAATFALAAGLTLWQLDVALRALRRSRWRLLGFALSPALVLFGMQNWDLWALLPAAVGIAFAARRRPLVAAVWFGIGAAVKWWPGLLLVTLVAGAWARPEDDDGWRAPVVGRLPFDPAPIAITVGTWALLQVPAVLLSPSGWLASIAFHLGRLPNFDSTASALAAFGQWLAPGRFWGTPFSTLFTVASLGLLLAGTVYVGIRLRDRTLDPASAGLALVGLFLLTGKVFSPQFVLWLLPVAVVARVPWTPILAVEAANAAVWFMFGPWMAHPEDPAFSGFLRAAQALSVVRSLTVAWVVAVALLALPRQEQTDQHEHHPDHGRQQPERAVPRVPRE